MASASSWGCELKYLNYSHRLLWSPSASSWGCELKYTCDNSTDHPINVSLFVRLWVEILHPPKNYSLSASASSWGCELKSLFHLLLQPPGIVSLFVRLWVEMNMTISGSMINMSASSWGCELKYSPFTAILQQYCQPLREAVSWNARIGLTIAQNIVSLFVRLWVEMTASRRDR